MKSYNGYYFGVMIGCADGKYGNECKEECGHCRDVKQCVHSNGSCLTGCSDGFQGELCKTREYIPTIVFIKSLDIHTFKLKHIELTNANIYLKNCISGYFYII